jgi:beta-galactosidase
VGHWTWPGTEGKSRTVRIYSTCDEVELFLDGKSLGKRQPATTEELMAEWRKYGLLERRTELPPGAKLRHAPFIWRDVPYQPGVLKAAGTKSGKQYFDERVTAGAPYQIILQPDRDRITAGGRDAVRIVATIADEHGVMVPSANPWITVQAAGPGDLLGTPVLDAVWGMAAINIQSRAEAGELIVTASSHGIKLKEGRCRIVSSGPK